MPRHGGAPIPSAGQLLVGTSGYSYKQWKGSFYPEKLPDREMLSFYAKQFSTVEINHSFYRMPTENLLLQWAKTVPEGFRFALKANQQITHIQRLRNCESTLKRFLEVASVCFCLRGPSSVLVHRRNVFRSSSAQDGALSVRDRQANTSRCAYCRLHLRPL